MKSIQPILYILSFCLLTVYATAQQSDSSTLLANAIKSESDPVRKEKLLRDLERYAGNSSSNALSNLDFYRNLVATAFAESGNVQKTNYWISRTMDPVWMDNAVIGSVQYLIEQNKLSEAEALLMPYLKESAMIETTASSGPFNRPPKSVFEFEYATILYKRGKYKEALAYLTPQMTSVNNQEGASRRRVDTRKAEIYALTLIGAGNKEQALAEIEKLVFLPGKKSGKFMADARAFYAKHFGDDRYFQNLIDSAAVVKYKRAVEKMSAYEVDQPAPDFELKDMSGNTVSLASLRGKTVVIDFWATWCQPCVGSFPGMQRAVDYYKSDPSVVFLFIHTAEKSSTATEDAKRLLEINKHDFINLMDLKDPSTGRNPVMSAFNVRGLPTKFVINKDGRIRFKHSGFVAEGEAVEEIRAMVDEANDD